MSSKKIKKIINVLSSYVILNGMLLSGVSAELNNASTAINDDINTINKFENKSEKETTQIHVKTDFDLCLAIEKSDGDKEIILENDISLKEQINIQHSLNLDLNGHTLIANFNIGRKYFSHTKYEEVIHPGYYSWEKKKKTISFPGQYIQHWDGLHNVWVSAKKPDAIEETWENVWNPERKEVFSKDIYELDENIIVFIKNGIIKGENGENGKDGKTNTSGTRYESGIDGNAGCDGITPLRIFSGSLYLTDMTVIGGNGGKGGNGGFKEFTKFFIFGLADGSGGNGGKGGDGAAAVQVVKSDKCKFIKNETCKLVSGVPGEGGKGVDANPNYFIIPGTDGEDGEKGKQNAEVVYC